MRIFFLRAYVVSLVAALGRIRVLICASCSVLGETFASVGVVIEVERGFGKGRRDTSFGHGVGRIVVHGGGQALFRVGQSMLPEEAAWLYRGFSV